MTNPEWLGDFSKTDLENVLKYSGKIWIYYLKDEPICSMMIIPSDEHALKKFEIDENPENVIDYGPMFVNPKYWGNKLQYQMLRKLDDYCIKLDYKIAIATVHPDNYYSFNNLLKDDFKYTKTKEFSRGIRNIYVKDLRKKGL